MEPASYYLAIIEDKPVILDALLEFFSSSPNFNPIVAVESAEQFVEIWEEQRIDLLLCDVGLRGKSGVEVVWYVKRKLSSTQVQKGDSYKQIADKLSISAGTVKFHIRNVYGVAD